MKHSMFIAGIFLGVFMGAFVMYGFLSSVPRLPMPLGREAVGYAHGYARASQRFTQRHLPTVEEINDDIKNQTWEK